MKAPTLNPFAIACLCTMVSATIHAQDKPTFDGSFTLADNERLPPPAAAAAARLRTRRSGGGTGEETPEPRRRPHQRADPEQLGLRHRPGARDEIHGQHPAGRPLSISEDWNLIIRTILPVIYQGRWKIPRAGQCRSKSFRSGRHDAELLLLAQGTGGRLDSGRRAGGLLSHRHPKAGRR